MSDQSDWKHDAMLEYQHGPEAVRQERAEREALHGAENPCKNCGHTRLAHRRGSYGFCVESEMCDCEAFIERASGG